MKSETVLQQTSRGLGFGPQRTYRETPAPLWAIDVASTSKGPLCNGLTKLTMKKNSKVMFAQQLL